MQFLGTPKPPSFGELGLVESLFSFTLLEADVAGLKADGVKDGNELARGD